MAKVKAFHCIRPEAAYASQTAALPYDVYTREDAREAVKGKPLSFLNIDRPETCFSPEQDMYADKVYEKGAALFSRELEQGIYLEEGDAAYYLYELTVQGHSQTGIAAAVAVDDYLEGVVKRHENTRADKELDRIRHISALQAQTGPVFLAYPSCPVLREILQEGKKTSPLYDFVSEDGVEHRVWKLSAAKNQAIQQAFARMSALYIADGHHRAASAVKVCEEKRRASGEYTGQEAFHFFLAVLFAAEELRILPYNRSVADLAGLSQEDFLKALAKSFSIAPAAEGWEPRQQGEMGLYLPNAYYRLETLPCIKEKYAKDPVESLDVAYLQREVLDPVLQIQDPRTDTRISFIGGIRGRGYLKKLVEEGKAAAAFCMYPTSMEELLRVADAGRLMPPKSTWFEPKLRSGIFIRDIKEGKML